ncbi:MAG: iron oxidase [Steroidobacteraceae bacterium]
MKNAMSRRVFLGALPLTGAAIAATAMEPAVAVPAGKVSKKLAKYQEHPHDNHQCKACVHFKPPHSCKLVAGTIVPTGWCLFFAAKPKAA